MTRRGPSLARRVLAVRPRPALAGSRRCLIGSRGWLGAGGSLGSLGAYRCIPRERSRPSRGLAGRPRLIQRVDRGHRVRPSPRGSCPPGCSPAFTCTLRTAGLGDVVLATLGRCRLVGRCMTSGGVPLFVDQHDARAAGRAVELVDGRCAGGRDDLEFIGHRDRVLGEARGEHARAHVGQAVCEIGDKSRLRSIGDRPVQLAE
jgi:hypothetical protein